MQFKTNSCVWRLSSIIKIYTGVNRLKPLKINNLPHEVTNYTKKLALGMNTKTQVNSWRKGTEDTRSRGKGRRGETFSSIEAILSRSLFSLSSRLNLSEPYPFGTYINNYYTFLEDYFFLWLRISCWLSKAFWNSDAVTLLGHTLFWKILKKSKISDILAVHVH